MLGRLVFLATLPLAAALVALPAAARAPDARAWLALARIQWDAARYRDADSLTWLAVADLRARPPRSERERLALTDAIVRCARPATAAGCDTVMAWARWVADRHDAERTGSAREQAWLLAGRACQRASHGDSAAACFERAAAALRARPDHTADDEARLLARIASYHLANGRTRDMARYATAAIEAWDRAPGADSLTLAFALVSRARMRAERGAADSAGADLEVAQRVLLTRLGPDHGELVSLWQTIASVRAVYDDPRGCTAAMAEALRINALTRPPGDQEFGFLYTQASALWSASGDYVEACRYGRLAVSASETRFGRESVPAARSRLALANSLRQLGDRASALAEAREALAIETRILPELNGERAYALSVLGAVELDLEQYAEGYQHYRDSARIREALLGPEHPSTLHSLTEQGEGALGLGRVAEAQALLDRVARAEEAQGHSTTLLDTWCLLAETQLLGGRDSLALATMDRVVSVADTMYGATSAPARHHRWNRLPFLRHRGHVAQALDEALALSVLEREQLGWTSMAVPEREALAAAEVHSDALAAAIELACSPGLPADAARRAWDELARSRALVFRIQAERRERRGASDAGARAAFAQVDSTRAALAREVMEPIEGTAVKRAERLDSLRRAAEESERALAARLPAHADDARAPGIAALLATLAPDERLVAFARFKRLEADSPSAVPGGERPLAYAAFVGDRGGRVVAVPLGDAAPLEARVARWFALVTRAAHDSTGEAALERRTAEAGEAVRRGFWDPLAPRLAAARRVDVVPEGAVTSVDFAALPARRATTLAEAGPLIVPLATERDVLPQPHAGRGMLVLGAPDFDRGGAAAEPLAATVERSAIPDSLRLHFGALPESGEEAREALAAFDGAGAEGAPRELRLGADASEAALRREAPGCGLLHVATHGFLIDGERLVAPATGERGVSAIVESPSARRALVGGVDWSVAGLALAGANVAGPRSPAADDGYLTGAEIVTLDLRPVRCAVLSACRTGAARADRFESLQGLERAFRGAGVGQVVMSLWPVDDADARAWMRAFYREHLGRGRSVAEAVRAADLERLRALRSPGRTPRPARWAPFFVRGERD